MTFNSSKWTQLQRCPNQSILSNLIQLNDETFITCGERKSFEPTFKISKFNTRTNTWTQIKIHDTEEGALPFDIHTISLGTSSHTLFACGSPYFCIIDMDNHTLKLKKEMNSLCNEKLKHSRNHCMYGCVSLMINEQCHIIGGKRNTSHLIWQNDHDMNNNSFQTIHTFHELGDGLQKAGFVYLKSKQICLLFGGYDLYSPYNPKRDIWMCSLNVKKWTKVNAKLPKPLYGFGYCLTRNERFIILFNGMLCDNISTYEMFESDDIFVWDLQSMQFYKSKIKCPQKYEYRALIMNDQSMETVLISWIRKHYKKESIFPSDVIYMIHDWIGIECVYLVDYLVGATWKMCVANIVFQIDEECITSSSSI